MRYSNVESTYILGNFNDGDTVAIDVYKLSDSSKVVDTASCSEIGTTGVFSYNFSQTVSAKEEYLWIMSNGSSDQRGKIVLGGYPDGIKNETDKIQTGIIDAKDSFKATGFATINPPSQNLDDYKADVTNLDAPISSRASQTSLDTVKALVNTLLDIEQGNWEIDPDTKQMIFYTRQGQELMRFNLYDNKGNLAIKSVFKRVRQ